MKILIAFLNSPKPGRRCRPKRGLISFRFYCTRSRLHSKRGGRWNVDAEILWSHPQNVSQSSAKCKPSRQECLFLFMITACPLPDPTAGSLVTTAMGACRAEAEEISALRRGRFGAVCRPIWSVIFIDNHKTQADKRNAIFKKWMQKKSCSQNVRFYHQTTASLPAAMRAIIRNAFKGSVQKNEKFSINYYHPLMYSW